MTYEEQQQYNKLPYSQQRAYDRIKSENPGWGHRQIMFKVAMEKKTDDFVNSNSDPNPEDPEILAEILRGAKSFLVGLGIFIAEVFEVIDDMLCTLVDLIDRGIRYVGDKLEEFWEWLTS